MATVPLSGTNIRLLSGVPFSNDYKYTRWFDNQPSQTTYFLGKPVIHSMAEANFQRIEGYNFISVNKSIDELWGTNYLMFQNVQYNSKWFYGFVTKLEYKQKNLTYVHFQIDVFQTWKFEMNFKPSYVVREHCQLWNADGSPVINTVDEGLNYGTEYETSSVSNYQPNDGYKWLVILTKTPIHNGATNKVTPSVIGTPQPLSVYIAPFKDDDTVPPVVMPDGSGMVASKPTQILTNLYVDETAVNNVVGLYVTDFTGIPVTGASGGTITFPNNGNELQAVQVSDGGTGFFNCILVKKVIDFDTITYNNGSKYTGYETVKESKLLMSPYTQLILDDFKGNRATFKTEYINSPDIEILIKGSLGTSNKTSYGLLNYNFGANGLKEQVSDEFALINNEPNDIPIITDLLSAYLQGNRNSIQNQRATTSFNGYMGITNGLMNGLGSAMSGNVGGALSSVSGMVQGAGNTVLQLQGMQAKRQDIANTPPSIAKMGSNTSYTLGNNYNGVFIIKKQIKAEYIRKLEHFFNLFGYKVNEVKTPNFHTRQYWNYVQTSSCVITGNFNNEDLNELKAIFDNGITFWHTDDVGNYSLSNAVFSSGGSQLAFLPYGDSKTYGVGDTGTNGTNGYPPLLINLLGSQWSSLTRIGRPGYTVAEMLVEIDSDLASRTDTPTHILFNLGANDVNPTQPQLNETTWKNNVLTIVDKMHAKWPNVIIYLARIWRETNNGQMNTMNDIWIPSIVQSRSFVQLGIDEREYLPTMNTDGIHPNHEGYVRTSEEWRDIIG